MTETEIEITDAMVEAAWQAYAGGAGAFPHQLVAMRAALTAALRSGREKAIREYAEIAIEEARNAVEELANTQMNISIEDWSRISGAILSALHAKAGVSVTLAQLHAELKIKQNKIDNRDIAYGVSICAEHVAAMIKEIGE